MSFKQEIMPDKNDPKLEGKPRRSRHGGCVEGSKGRPEIRVKKSTLYQFMRNWGLALTRSQPLPALFYLIRYFSDWRKFRRMNPDEKPRLADTYPCLTDWVRHTPVDPHYFYQAAWLARRLRQETPTLHVDVGSSAMMINILSAWVKTIFVDYRPLRAKLSNVQSIGGDVLRLPFGNAAASSVSCLHVIEHIGLGRYGDPLDAQGSIKAAAELSRVLKAGGRLYISTPVGRERVCFNAHRVFDPQRLADLFPGLFLVEFSFVDDAGCFHENAQPASAQRNEYGCGMYVFGK